MQTETSQATNAAYSASLTQPPVLLTVRQFSEKHPAFQQGCLRNMIFLSRKGKIAGNLEAALVRIGRKLLIDEAKFFNWIDAQQGEK